MTRKRSQLPFALGAVLALGAASCSHAVLVQPTPSYEVLAFEAGLPVDAAVFVDADQMLFEARIPDFADFTCANNSYPVDARESFEASVVGTLERLVRKLEHTPAPLNREEMEARRLGAVIVVRVDSFGVGVSTGFFRGFEAGADVAMQVSAFTADGLQIRDFVQGSSVQTGGGSRCSEGAQVVAQAVETAIGNAMTELGELIVNSPALRTSLGLAAF